jgi:hypothetical protein
MPVGNWTWFDRAKLKVGDGTFVFSSHTFNAVLLTSTQSISNSFTGTSGDCRYADLTAELGTANGYTVGGNALTSVSFSRNGTAAVRFYGTATWTITSNTTFKYVAIYDFSATNKDLVCFLDIDTSGGSVTNGIGTLQFSPDTTNGMIGWS